jgi:hypothetical protein
MKSKFFAAFLGLALVATGCVNTVSSTKTVGVPFVKDTIESRYERPADQVFQAAKEVIQYNGALVSDGVLYGRTNTVNNIAKTLEGKVRQDTVWVRVEQVTPKITAVAVQTRTQGGVADIDLSAEIDKQIVLKLAR